MKNLQKIIIKNFKNIDNLEIDLSQNNLILINGENGSGKTAILDAIMFCVDDKSYAGNKIDGRYIRKGANFLEVSIVIDNVAYTRKIEMKEGGNSYFYKKGMFHITAHEWDKEMEELELKREYMVPSYFYSLSSKELINVVAGIKTDKIDSINKEIRKLKEENEKLLFTKEFAEKNNIPLPSNLISDLLTKNGDMIYKFTLRKEEIESRIPEELMNYDNIFVRNNKLRTNIDINDLPLNTINFSQTVIAGAKMIKKIKQDTKILLIDFGESLDKNTKTEIVNMFGNTKIFITNVDNNNLSIRMFKYNK